MKPDPRLNAYRTDLADIRLESEVEAARYVAGEARQIVDSVVNILAAPRADAQCTSQALFGEHVTVFDNREGWAWALANLKLYLEQGRTVTFEDFKALLEQYPSIAVKLLEVLSRRLRVADERLGR